MPASERFVPLLYTLGAANGRDRPRALNHGYFYASPSMTAYLLED